MDPAPVPTVPNTTPPVQLQTLATTDALTLSRYNTAIQRAIYQQNIELLAELKEHKTLLQRLVKSICPGEL